MRGSPVPLYYRIAETLRERIAGRHWQPGDRLPGEHELMSEFAVSRHTVRQALSLLENEGFVYRQAGLGTFVRSEKSSYPLTHLQGFTEQMEERGLIPSSRVLRLGRAVPRPDVRSALALPKGQEVWELVRLRLANGEPMAVETTFAPAALVPGLDREDLSSLSFYRYVEEKLGRGIAGATQTIEAEVAYGDLAKLLLISPGNAVLRVKNVTFLNNMRPLCFVDCYYRADRYAFSVAMPRQSRGAMPGNHVDSAERK
ncbi:MAG: GntR family transcriptional regulator [Bacillota bacterium]